MSIRHTNEEGVGLSNSVKLAKVARGSSISIPASKIQDLSDPAVISSATNVGSNRPYNNGAAVVSFAPAATGGTTSGAEFTSFTVTSTPGSITGTATTSPVTVTGLASATTYTFKVAGINVSGVGISSASSASVAVTTVPQAPTAGTALNVPAGRAYNNGLIQVPVTANASGGSAIISYLVTSSPGSLTGTGTSSPISVTGLLSDTAYTFTAQAVNANGTSLASTASNSATATTVPQAPILGVPTDVGTNRPYNNGAVSIPVTGGATGGSAITGFTATSTPGGLVTSNAGTTPIIATGLTVGTTYGFTVTATNANGVSTGTATGTNVVPTSVPQTPTLGTVTTTSGIVYIPFTAGGTGGKAITSYTIVSSPALTLTYSGTTSPIAVTAAYAQGQAYTFTLTAVNANGNSITTAASNAITPLATITDNFNRTGSSLGISSSGATWVGLQGSWSTNGTQGVAASSGTSLASVPFGNANAVVSASVSSGTGVAFWVTDANSWWAATTYYSETVTQANTVFYDVYYANATCTGPTSTTTYSHVGGSTSFRYCQNGGDFVSCSGTTFQTNCFLKTYTCPSGQFEAGGYCYSNIYPYAITGSTPVCANNNYVAAIGYNCDGLSCPAGQSGPTPGSSIGLSQGSCYCGTTTSAYSCTCAQGTPNTPTASSSTCSSTFSSYACPSGTQSGSQCFSQFYYLRMYSSVGGTVTNPVTDINIGAAAAAIKVTTSGNNVTAQAYSNTSLATTLGAAMTATNTGTKGTSSGIIRTTSGYNQGNTVDNFSSS